MTPFCRVRKWEKIRVRKWPQYLALVVIFYHMIIFLLSWLLTVIHYYKYDSYHYSIIAPWVLIILINIILTCGSPIISSFITPINLSYSVSIVHHNKCRLKPYLATSIDHKTHQLFLVKSWFCLRNPHVFSPKMYQVVTFSAGQQRSRCCHALLEHGWDHWRRCQRVHRGYHGDIGVLTRLLMYVCRYDVTLY